MHFNVVAVLDDGSGGEFMTLRTTVAHSWDSLDAVMTRLCDQECMTAEDAGEGFTLVAMTVIKDADRPTSTKDIKEALSYFQKKEQ